MDESTSQLEDEELLHLRALLVEHKRYLHIVERQIAGHGRLDAPPDLLRKEEIVKEEMRDVTQRIRRRIKNINGDEILYSDEEVDVVVDRLLDIHAIELKLDSLIAVREELKRAIKLSKRDKLVNILNIF